MRWQGPGWQSDSAIQPLTFRDAATPSSRARRRCSAGARDDPDSGGGCGKDLPWWFTDGASASASGCASSGSSSFCAAPCPPGTISLRHAAADERIRGTSKGACEAVGHLALAQKQPLYPLLHLDRHLRYLLLRRRCCHESRCPGCRTLSGHGHRAMSTCFTIPAGGDAPKTS